MTNGLDAILAEYKALRNAIDRKHEFRYKMMNYTLIVAAAMSTFIATNPDKYWLLLLIPPLICAFALTFILESRTIQMIRNYIEDEIEPKAKIGFHKYWTEKNPELGRMWLISNSLIFCGISILCIIMVGILHFVYFENVNPEYDYPLLAIAFLELIFVIIISIELLKVHCRVYGKKGKKRDIGCKILYWIEKWWNKIMKKEPEPRKKIDDIDATIAPLLKERFKLTGEIGGYKTGKKIDDIDRKIAPLLKERFKLTEEIAEWKIKINKKTKDEKRRAEVLKNVIKSSKLDEEDDEFKKDYEAFTKKLYGVIFDEHEKQQRKLKKKIQK